MKTFKIAAPVIGVLLFALPVFAQSIDVQAQIAGLLAQIKMLQTQIAQLQGSASPSTSSACPTIVRTLSIGASGDDVRCLQMGLARDPSVYPEGTVTGYYGPLTAKAVQRYQARMGIVSSGNAQTTGYGVVGPQTAAQLTSGGYTNWITPPTNIGTECNGVSVPCTPTSGGTAACTTSSTGVTTCSSGTTSGEAGIGGGWSAGGAAPECTVIVPKPTTTCVSPGSWTFLPTDNACHGSWVCAASIGGSGNGTVAPQTTSTVSPSNPTNPPVTADSVVLSASPRSGRAPLSVSFSASVQDANQYIIEYADGSNSGPLHGTCWSTQVGAGPMTLCTVSASHTYASAGTYTATLSPYAACLYSGPVRCMIDVQPLGSATITVTSSATH